MKKTSRDPDVRIQDLDDVYQATLAGETVRQICSRLDVSRQTVQNDRAHLLENLPDEFSAQLRAHVRVRVGPSMHVAFRCREDRLDAVYQATLARESAQKIAPRVGANRNTVQNDRAYLLENLPDEFSAQLRKAFSKSNQDERLDEVYQSRLSGKSKNSIADSLEVSLGTIGTDLDYLYSNLPDEFSEELRQARCNRKAADGARKTASTKLSVTERLNAVCQLTLSGKSVRAIATSLGLSPGTVQTSRADLLANLPDELASILRTPIENKKRSARSRTCAEQAAGQ